MNGKRIVLLRKVSWFDRLRGRNILKYRVRINERDTVKEKVKTRRFK